MKGFGTTLMLASAVIFLAALLFLTAGKFSMVWVILLIAAPFAFILGIPGQSICLVTQNWRRKHAKNVMLN